VYDIRQLDSRSSSETITTCNWSSYFK